MTENTTTTETTQPQPVKILVLQRGWVAIGRHSKDGAEHVLTDASVIRRWGTTKGLGQLATDGPQANTVLDATGTVRAHELATVLVIDADATVWADRL
jgi:hypothetical protein